MERVRVRVRVMANPNPNHPTTRQHAVVSIRLNIVTCPTYPIRLGRLKTRDLTSRDHRNCGGWHRETGQLGTISQGWSRHRETWQPGTMSPSLISPSQCVTPWCRGKRLNCTWKCSNKYNSWCRNSHRRDRWWTLRGRQWRDFS